MHEEETLKTLVTLEIKATQEMIDAIQYIVDNAKGLGYESVDEFVRSAIRERIIEIAKKAVQQ